MRKTSIYITVLLGILFSSCKEENDDPLITTRNNQEIIVDSSLFIHAPNDKFDFSNVEIIDDSLRITFRYGGGCGDIELMLIDSEAILESYPVQRNIRLSLNDKDTCKALISKTFSFDLTEIRVKGNNKVLLNLTGWDFTVLYEY